MKNRILNLTLVLVIMVSTIFMLTGCGNKTENIIVYINDGLSDSKITEIEKELKEMDDVNSISYTSKAEALREAKENFKKEGVEDIDNLLSEYTEKYHPFPASFTIEVKKSKNYDEIIKKIESIDGVKEVQLLPSAKDLINAEMNYIKNQR